jgi:hypothetical protein
MAIANGNALAHTYRPAEMKWTTETQPENSRKKAKARKQTKPRLCVILQSNDCRTIASTSRRDYTPKCLGASMEPVLLASPTGMLNKLALIQTTALRALRL